MFQRAQIERGRLLNNELKIGMMPKNMIPEFMNSFYLKSMNFYKEKKGYGCKLEIDEESYMNEKILII